MKKLVLPLAVALGVVLSTAGATSSCGSTVGDIIGTYTEVVPYTFENSGTYPEIIVCSRSAKDTVLNALGNGDPGTDPIFDTTSDGKHAASFTIEVSDDLHIIRKVTLTVSCNNG